MVERDETSPKLEIPNPSRSGNRILEADPAARNNRNQGKSLGTKLGALQGRSRGVYLREVIRQHLPLLEKEYWHHFVRQVEDQTFDELFQQIVMQAMADDDAK